MNNFLKLDYRLLQALPSNDAIVLSYIKGYQDNNLTCFEKQEDIAEKLGMGIATVKRLIAKYANLGIITKDNKAHNYKNRKSLYINETLLNELIDEDYTPTSEEPNTVDLSDLFQTGDTEDYDEEIMDEVVQEEVSEDINLTDLAMKYKWEPDDYNKLVSIFDNNVINRFKLKDAISRLIREFKYNDYTGPSVDIIRNLKQEV